MAGIYIHIPFCKQACSYCDFHFSTSFEKYRTRMVKAICKEIEVRKSYLKAEEIFSIYFGGGTPSVLNAEEIRQLVDSILSNFKVNPKSEITLEANPDDINAERLEDWKKAGVNRLSIGVQSFRKQDLDWMNRAHTVEEAKSALRLAANYGFELSIDVIYGLPNFTLEDFKNNLDQVLHFSPAHLSAYCLTVEENTALHKAVEQGKIVPANNEAQSEQFDFLVAYLQAKGYEQYEISNFAREEKYAVHNSNYWKGEKYLGVGPSAHSFDGYTRSWNIANNAKYMKAIENQEDFYEVEELSIYDQFNEALLVGLRTKWGVAKHRLPKELLNTEEFRQGIEEFKAEGYLLETEEVFLLTQKGRLKADGIASDLFILAD
ncbi:oxygen-independent coproporphyrinogen-3 oxidase [Lishizhenia tianjinensis]|uniref:Heme chaperone HemW n=1 Tax=Lishizhenia tianjinensis TaxID=477690 RepID=A0A1I7BAN2_9FLAO|nr:radical SAM family heme chaperone HemW [Lishizhenia tianjinensis]SFT84243.1 oxygen-independent coproporphyrinogen-3 oxidase [Lishizhenia tianjinensis]